MAQKYVERLSAPRVAAVTRFFSSPVIRELSKFGVSPTLARLLAESKIAAQLSPGTSLGEMFEFAFSLLKHESLRSEYVYKTALVNKLLLGVHSPRTASILTEFSVESSKADVVVLNGTSTVYEIKSERDRLDRLGSQISSFRMVFANVNVIAGVKHVDAVLELLPEDVGVFVLTDRFQISTVRKPSCNVDRISPEAVFNSLRTKEVERVLRELGFELPHVPNTKKHEVLKQRFLTLSPQEAHKGLMRVLKETRSPKRFENLFATLPKSLSGAVISVPIRVQDFDKLVAAMDVPIKEVSSWGS